MRGASTTRTAPQLYANAVVDRSVLVVAGGQPTPGADQWLLPDPGLLPLHVSPRLSSADVTAGLLVPSESPLGSAGPSALPSSAGGSAGMGTGGFFAASHNQHPEQGGGLDMPHDAAHMLTEPSGIGAQACDAPHTFAVQTSCSASQA